MKLTFKGVLLSSLTLCLVMPFLAHATNGYFLIGFGAKSRAMGGTGVAYTQGAMAAAFNPATMINSGSRFDLGAEFFNPPRAIQHDSGLMGQTNERSTTDLFVIPSMGATIKWNKDLTIGFAFIGAGLQTEFDQSVHNVTCSPPGAPVPCPSLFDINRTGVAAPEAGVELMQGQMMPGFAYRLNDTHTIGGSVVMALQYFRAEGLEEFGAAGFTSSSDGEGVTGAGFSHSFGQGFRLGWLGSFLDDNLNIGLNYSSRVHMTKFRRYTSLFAEGGDFDIPENYAIGFAYKATPKITVAFDVQQINYSKIKSIGNPGPLASNPSSIYPLCQPPADITPCLLGGPLGLGFGWTDMTVYKLGVDWQYNEKLNLRAGWNFGKAPIPEDQVLFNLLAPATPENHLTFGAEYKINDTFDLAVNYMHAFLNTIKGPTAFGVGGATVTGTNASIAMEQNSLGATLGIHF